MKLRSVAEQPGTCVDAGPPGPGRPWAPGLPRGLAPRGAGGRSAGPSKGQHHAATP
jgi:hypothetical protein